MFKRYINWLINLNTASKLAVVFVVYAGMLAVSGLTAPVHKSASTPTHSQVASAHIEHTTVVTTEAIPFKTTTTENPQLPAGTTRIVTPGVVGERTHSYDVTYKNGVEVSRVEIANLVTIEPQDQVEEVGTATAPSGPTPGSRCHGEVTFFGINICRPPHGD